MRTSESGREWASQSPARVRYGLLQGGVGRPHGHLSPRAQEYAVGPWRRPTRASRHPYSVRADGLPGLSRTRPLYPGGLPTADTHASPPRPARSPPGGTPAADDRGVQVGVCQARRRGRHAFTGRPHRWRAPFALDWFGQNASPKAEHGRCTPFAARRSMGGRAATSAHTPLAFCSPSAGQRVETSSTGECASRILSRQK